MTLCRVLILLFLVSIGVSLGRGAAAGDRRVYYSRDVRPILSQACFSCHGPDEGSREAGLRLDQRPLAIAQLESGQTAIRPGHADQSELIARVLTDDASIRMPPAETGKSLTPDQIETLRLWIQQGAEFSEHWSFLPLTDPTPPTVGELAEAGQVRNPIDQFIIAKLKDSGLSPSPEAARQILIRRLAFDLTGLPPTFEQVNRFVADDRPEAYEQLVDDLLNSPHFGERWGRHWLDIARYADSNGYLGDELRPDAYRYRDWVINAVNQDLPFRDFTIQQIAGDLLPDATNDQRIAAGLHRNAMKNTEAGADRELDRVVQTVDRLSTVGTAWMGLTIGCAECHSHKFDPISHKEFYELYAFFNSLNEADVVLGMKPAPTESAEKKQERESKLQKIEDSLLKQAPVATDDQKAAFRQSLATLALPTAERGKPDQEALEKWRADLTDAGRKLAKDYEKLALQRPRPTPIVAPGVTDGKPRETFIHYRGDYKQPGEKVTAKTPAFLPSLQPRGETADRLDLAQWLTRPDHPLVPRVAVNQIWLQLFGRGLVETADNFGMAGAEPTHPELLDWLASRFLESGGSRKAMIKLIVMSAAYRQSSRQTQELRERDPQNLLLGRQLRMRLEAEIVRDVALASSGLLNPVIGGPGIRPPMTSRIAMVSRNREWKESEGPDRYRRGMYIIFRRATPFPMLTQFDAPASTIPCVTRARSNSPLQALVLLNDPVFVECAQKLGKDLAKLGPVPPRDWIGLAVQRTLSRSASPEELDRLLAFYEQQRGLIAALNEQDMQKLVGEQSSPVGLAEASARVIVARSLMNLDEFITRE